MSKTVYTVAWTAKGSDNETYGNHILCTHNPRQTPQMEAKVRERTQHAYDAKNEELGGILAPITFIFKEHDGEVVDPYTP